MLKLEGAQLKRVRWPVVAIDAVHGPMFAFFQFLLASALCLEALFTVGRILSARDRTHQAQHCNHCDSRQNFLHYFLLGLYFELARSPQELACSVPNFSQFPLQNYFFSERM